MIVNRKRFMGAIFSILVLGSGIVRSEPKPLGADADPRVRMVLEARDFHLRLQAVRSLPGNLSSTDAEALYQGVVQPLRAKGIPPEQWAALYNDVLNVLNDLKTPLPNYEDRLQKLIAEEVRDEVLRDYALQHLLAYMESRLGPKKRYERIIDAETVAFSATRTTLPGTYLLGIYQQSGKPGYPDKEHTVRAALDIASDPEAFVPNRISAMQICAQLGALEALPLALTISKNEALPTGLRMAAISAIGDLGSEDHKILLRKIKHRHASDFRLGHAADVALQKLP